VRVADDPPSHRAVRGRLIGSPASCVEVMTAVTSNVGAGKDPAGNGKSTPEARKAAAVAAEPSKSKRAGKPAYERPENSEPRPSPLQAALSKLAQPVDLAADPAQIRDELELQRLRILEQANEVARSQLEYEINQREYNLAHGLTPAAAGPSKLGLVRSRGGRLQTELNRDGRTARSGSSTRYDRTERSRSRSHASDSYVSAGRPKYSTPVKNLRAAKAAAAELSSLTGEALRKQQGRVQELIDIAEQQNIEIKKKNPEAGASGVIYSAKGAADKSAGQAASSPGGKQKNPSVNSGKSKLQQLIAYDPALAGKQIANQGHVDQNAGHVGQGHQQLGHAVQGPVAQNYAVNPHVGQNYQVAGP